MNITPGKISHLCSQCKPEIAKQLAEILPAVLEQYSINTPLRVVHFLAQTAHESAGFTRFEENLNYSGEGLMATFPKYFRTIGTDYHKRNPEKIANRVYANRMGNGAEASGDGWKYRGRGLIQLTGKANYAAFSKDTGLDAIEHPELLATVEGAVKSAAWFWYKHQLNLLADADSCLGITKAINGGINGLDERKRLLARAKDLFQVDF
jgi:putative chitinase